MGTTQVSYHSLGMDIGTTTMHALVSKIEVRRNPVSASMELERFEIIHRSPVVKTPYHACGERIDESAIQRWLLQQVDQWGLQSGALVTGGVIVTGVAACSSNASRVIESVSGLCGDMVATIAGSRMESWLAAQGSGAVAWSKRNLKRVVSIDIGGGTSNIALIQNGELIDEASLWIGGRMVRFSAGGEVASLHPALDEFCSAKSLPISTRDDLRTVIDSVAEQLLDCIEQREIAPCLIDEPFRMSQPFGKIDTIAISGGVAAIADQQNEFEFDDCGVMLARAVRRVLQKRYTILPVEDPIRATVIGAGVYSTQVSGDTIFCNDPGMLPRRNCVALAVPIHSTSTPDSLIEAVTARMNLLATGQEMLIALHPTERLAFRQLETVACACARMIKQHSFSKWMMAIEPDAAKLLGYMLEEACEDDAAGCSILVFDRIHISDGALVDIGAALADGSVPITVKTCFFPTDRRSKGEPPGDVQPHDS